MTTETITDTVNALACSPEFARDGLCFAACNSGLRRSGDGGASWQDAYATLALAAPLGASAVALSPDFARDRTVFAGASGGVLRSGDGGATWQIITLPEPAPLVTALAVSPNFASDGLVFAGTMEDGAFRSGDGGRTWAAWNFGLTDPCVLALATSPTFASDQTLFAGTSSGVFRSTNSGRGWRALALPCGFADVLSLAFANGALLAGTESAGLFRSDDMGQRWQPLGAGALDGAINAIVPLGQGTGEILVLLNDTPLGSRDAGRSWQPWPGAPRAGVSALAVPGETEVLLAGMLAGDVVRF
jgi:photosystem II stability/assembly factor-like uncharacterized protein